MRKVRIIDDDEIVLKKPQHEALLQDSQCWFFASHMLTDEQHEEIVRAWYEEYGNG